MKTLHIIILITFYQFILAQCETGFTEINNECYYQTDLEVLQTFIDSSTTINMDMDANDNGIIEPLELGIQEWENGRLKILRCHWNDSWGSYNCELSVSIPENIENLFELTVLDITHSNLIGSIPENIGNLTKLTKIDFYGNDLTGPIPESIGNLTELTYLQLGINELSGPIPESIGNLVNLNSLYLFNNNLIGNIPESIGNLSLLENFLVGVNNISGIIPNTICDIGNIEDASFSNNQFCEPFPSCIDINNIQNQECNYFPNCLDDFIGIDGYCYFQQDLDVLQGFISSSTTINMNMDINGDSIINPLELGVQEWEYGRLTSINCTFNFTGSQNCELSGNIPENIGEISELHYLNFTDNNLSGSIPESIGNLTSLIHLYLGGNNLSGSIPESIGNLNTLFELSLEENNLSGQIPISVCTINHSSQFSFENNQLCPPYPSCLGNFNMEFQDLTNCENLGLNCEEGYAEIIGGACLSLEDLSVLQELINSSTYLNMNMDVNGDEIVQPIELFNQNWQNGRLISLSYEGNAISGPLPESIGNLDALSYLSLENSNLNGNIPETIGNLYNLTHLNLSRNNLSGNIPESIENLTSLTYLNLGSNKLSGNIPESIGNLPLLNSLSLHGNLLNGLVPNNICDFLSSYQIYLNDNQLCPPYPECINDSSIEYQDCNHYPNCLENFIGIDDYCYNQNDLNVLSYFIDNSTFLNMNMDDNLDGIIQPLELGAQVWNDGRLTVLILSGASIQGGSIPQIIVSLTSLELLLLTGNNFNGIIPNGICNLSNLTGIGLPNNNFCPPYPECIDSTYIGTQNCILGCMDSEAPNYDENANNDNGSCIYAQTINTGNNLISFTGVPNPSTVAEFLDDYPVNFILGQGQGLFRIDGEWSGNLTNFDGYSGYWVNASEPFELQYNLSNTFNTCEDYPLSIGNNLVSYIGTNNQNTLTSLSGEENYTDHINFIISQGQGLFNLNGEWSGNLTNLNKYNGYWLNLKSSWPFENNNGNKIFRWGIGEDCTEPDVSSNLIKELSNIPAKFQFAQSTEQAFYLIKDIEDIENGDIITAYCGEQLVGSTIWDGEYTAIPVMGRDVSEQTVGFCEPNEVPSFVWKKDQGEGKMELIGDIPGFANLGVYTIDKLESVENVILPTEWSLAPAYPNPFNPKTTIEIGVPEMVETRRPSMNSGQAVSLQVFDINGRLINTLINGHLDPGFHTIEWDATGFPSGLYFVKMVAGNPSINSGQGYTKSQKLMLVK